MRRPRITDADWNLIRMALNDAMDERESYADAWPKGTPERATALDWAKQYEALHRKLFGGDSARKQQNDAFAAMETVPITELHKRIIPTADRATAEKALEWGREG